MSRHFMSAALTAVLAVSTVGAASISLSSHAHAAGSGQWAQWAFTSTTAGSLKINPDVSWPTATFTITGGSGSSPSGSTAFLNGGTPIGQVFGSSRDKPYASIGVPIGTDVPGTPSVTTITFSGPTPSSGWAFALGDVDAEDIVISATDANGVVVDITSWFTGTFNYCDSGSPKPSTCPSGTSTDTPTWNPPKLEGNKTDTSGASAWFQPTASIKTLTFSQTRNVQGGPSYQLWFVSSAVPPPPPPQVFTLNIDGNQGSCSTAQISGADSTWGNLPGADACTRPDHVLVGFNTSADGSGLSLIPDSAVQFTGDNTVYAIWEKIVPPPTTPPEVVLPPGVNDLSPGEILVVDAGQVVPAIITPNPPQTAVDVSVNDWTMSIGGVTSEGSPAPLGANGSIVVQPGFFVDVTGTGFAPGTPVAVYALDGSVVLGTATVDLDGNFSASFAVPAQLPSGTYLIQANGYGPGFDNRSVSMAVQVVNPLSLSLRRTVYFDVLSSRLNATDKKILRRATQRVAADAFDIRVRSVGFVQPTPNRSNDASLSSSRAQNTANFVRQRGVQGQYSVSGQGRAEQQGAKARRATITITYTILR